LRGVDLEGETRDDSCEAMIPQVEKGEEDRGGFVHLVGRGGGQVG
jgi:hypothetical protein